MPAAVVRVFTAIVLVATSLSVTATEAGAASWACSYNQQASRKNVVSGLYQLDVGIWYDECHRVGGSNVNPFWKVSALSFSATAIDSRIQLGTVKAQIGMVGTGKAGTDSVPGKLGRGTCDGLKTLNVKQNAGRTYWYPTKPPCKEWAYAFVINSDPLTSLYCGILEATPTRFGRPLSKNSVKGCVPDF